MSAEYQPVRLCGVATDCGGAYLAGIQLYRVTIESDHPLKYKQFSLQNPERIVVDLKNVHLNSVLKGMDKQVQDRDPHLKLIRVGQNDPQTVRLVFEVKQAMSRRYWN